MLKWFTLVGLFVFCSIQASAETVDSLQLGNGTLVYSMEGSGEPMLLLSGGPGINSRQMDDVGAFLSKKYRVIYFDQRGTGNSWTFPMDSTTINLKTAFEDIEQLRKHLKIDQWNIAAESWGGILSAAYIAHHPKCVKNVIIIGGGELSREMTSIVNNNIELRFQLGDTLIYNYWTDSANVARDPKQAKYQLRRLIWLSLVFDREKVDSVMLQASRGQMNPEMNRLMWQSLNSNEEPWIEMIRKKYKGNCIIIFGWQDPIGSITLSQYQAAFPMAKVVGLDKSGHLPSVEQKDAFFAALTSYLNL